MLPFAWPFYIAPSGFGAEKQVDASGSEYDRGSPGGDSRREQSINGQLREAARGRSKSQAYSQGRDERYDGASSTECQRQRDAHQGHHERAEGLCIFALERHGQRGDGPAPLLNGFYVSA